jgi:dihydropteroate synthase
MSVGDPSGEGQVWRLSPDRWLPLDRPRIMAILNVTPDSFSDGGEHADPGKAAEGAARFVAEGADVIDIGGESTRPGAMEIPSSEQIARVVPAIRAIRSLSGAAGSIAITIDTTRPSVAAAALDAGADAINDVSGALDGLRDGAAPEAMLELAARRRCGIILMHRLRPPAADQYSDQYQRPPEYRDVVEEVALFLIGRARAAFSAGVDGSGVVVDPGLGFGKSVEQNMALVRGSAAIGARAGCPVLGAASRKSFVGRVFLGRDSEPRERVQGSIEISLMQLSAGVRLFRVHDVGAQSLALRAAWQKAGGTNGPGTASKR